MRTLFFFRYRSHLLLLFFSFASLFQPAASAQSMGNFPVQTTAYFMAPASQRLSDYFSSDKRLLVDLLLKDLTKTSAQVYLSWSLEAPGLRIQSRQGYIPPTFITLQRGVLQRLNGSDLQASYFQPNAIDAQGIDPNELYSTDLPEGFYTFRVQAIEAATGLPVSNTSETFLVLTAPQPPILNLPAPGTQLPVTALQQVPFLWSPRHFATPTSRVVYQLKVCPVPDDYEPNELVMNNCPAPLLDEQLPTLNFTGDITRFARPLEVGQRYAVQVTATDLNGQLTNFANQGRSQVSWFRYGKACSPPTFTIQSLGSDRVQLSWSPVEEAVGYRVEYKPEAESAWRPLRVSGRSTVIGGLDGTVPYLFRVSSDCGGLTPSAPSEIQRWTIREDTPEPAPLPPLELTHPGLIPVQVGPDGQPTPLLQLSDLYANWAQPATGSSSGTGASGRSPGATPATGRQGADSTARPLRQTPLRQIPRCALLASSFGGCQPDHPNLSLPTGENELTRLQVGDVLGIYDYAVVVTRVDAANPLAGQGLVRLPFLGGTLALVEFAGVQAKAGEDGTSGGCVYNVPPGGYFRTLAASQDAVLAAQQQLLQSLAPPDDSTRYRGTLAQALTAYEATRQPLDSAGAATLTASQQQTLVGYVGAIGQGLHTLQQQLAQYYGPQAPLGLVGQQLDQLLTTVAQLHQQLLTSQPVSVSSLSALSGRYEQLVSQLTRLQTPTPDTTTQAAIVNVALSQLSSSGVSLSWAGQGSLSRYVVRYQEQNGQDVVVPTRTPGLALSRLKAGTPYTFTIEGYGPDGSLLATYGKALFTTPARQLAPPTNLRYSVSNDNVVTIEWDKDKDHRRYQLVYTDPNGVERAFYPTTNQYKLTGLGPNQAYSYQIVAYGEDQLVSQPAQSNLRMGATQAGDCQVTLLTPTKTIIEGDSLRLQAKGCEGGTLRWSTGQQARTQLVVQPAQTTTYFVSCQLPGGGTPCTQWVTIQVEPTQCWSFTISSSVASLEPGDPLVLTASGCAGNLQWADGLGTSPSVRVYPTSATVFRASCLRADGQRCWASLSIPVNCAMALAISTEYSAAWWSLWGALDATKTVRLRASCSVGDFLVNGQKASYDPQTNTYSYELDGHDDQTIIASCGTDPERCTKTVEVPGVRRNCRYFSAYATEEKGQLRLSAYGCSEGNTVDWDNGQRGDQLIIPLPTKATLYKATCGRNGCQAFASYKPPTNSIQVKPLTLFDTQLAISGLGCQGGALSWRTEPDFPASPSTYVNENGAAYLLLPYAPAQSTTFVATCTMPDGRVSQGSYTYPAPASCLSLTNSPVSVAKGNALELNVLGCLGRVSWKANGTVVATGARLTDVPLTRTTYTAYCDDPACSVGRTIAVSGCALQARASKTTAIKSGETVSLSATGCAGGTINWQDPAGNFIGSGSSLTIRPLQSGQWQASCSTTDCVQSLSLTVPSVLPASITCEEFALSGPSSINQGEPNQVTLTASGCGGGVVSWNGPGLPANTQTQGQTHQLIIADLRDRATYSAQCKKPGFAVSLAQLTIQARLRLELLASPNPVESGKTTTLTATGCGGGLISWKDLAASGPSPCVAQSAPLTQATTFVATCRANGDTLTKQLTVGIRNANGASVYQPQGCAGFGAWYSYSDYSRTPPPRGTTVQLTAYGCPAGRVDWEADGLLISRAKTELTHAPQQTTTYTASCYSADGLLCARQPMTARIHQSACSSFAVQLTPNPIDRPARLGGSIPTTTRPDGSLSSSVTVDNVPYRIDITGCLSKDNPLFAGQITLTYLDRGNTLIPTGSTVPVSTIKISCQADPQSYPEDLCWRTITFARGYPIVLGTAEPDSPATTAQLAVDGRTTTATASPTGAARQAGDTDCQGSMEAATLLAGYMQTLLCANLESFYDDQQNFSEERVRAFLQSAVTALGQQPAFKGISFALPADLSSLLAGLKAANHQCTALPAVAEAATRNFSGALAVADYNQAATSSFPAVEQAAQAVLMRDLQCGCPGLADYKSGDGDCKSIIVELGKLKAAYTNHQNLTLTKPTKNPLTGQVSLGGLCYSDVQLTYVPDQTSLLIEPGYSQGTSSFGLGNGGNTYLTISLTNPQPGQLDSLKAYLFSGTMSAKASFLVTGAQLKQIFPRTAQSSCDEVAALLNKYSEQFGLTNAVRMSHFVGQIGAETNLSDLVEGVYSASRIKGVWTKATRSYKGQTVLKYCDLFEGYEATQTSDCPFPYCDPPLYEGTAGLEVKQKYIKSTALFDYVYACRLGNGSIDSKDGSRFRGRGFLQLTGYYNYQKELQTNWDLAYGKGNKDFLCRSVECDANLELVGTNLEIAMQTALAFWKAHNINEAATDITDSTIEKISEKVNGGTNGLPERKSYTKKAYGVFNQ